MKHYSRKDRLVITLTEQLEIAADKICGYLSKQIDGIDQFIEELGQNIKF